MDISSLSELGKPKAETDREKIERLTTEIHYQIAKEYRHKSTMDEIERAVLESVETDGIFDCSREGIETKIFGCGDHDNPILALHIGVMPGIDSDCLNIFTSKISNAIHENGNKPLIIDILSSFIISNLKSRLSKSKQYVFVGNNEDKNKGIIRKR